MQATNPREDVPGLEGPDYVALVIEWNDDDAATLVFPEPALEAARPSTTRTIVAVLGALGALALAAWGLRRLRTA
jgi:hypothetical protein